MAAYYVEAEEVWKCPKHPSRRRRNGICPTCLRDRLVSLCPDCAAVRPCACVSSSPSSSSSSGRVIFNAIDGEPSFRRSRSVAIPFLRSKNAANVPSASRTPSLLSVFRRSKTKRSGHDSEKSDDFNVNGGNSSDENFDSNYRIEDFARLITRSRSVTTGTTAMASGFRRVDVNPSPAKGKFWHFPSPMKVFRSSKTPKVVIQDRSPLHRA